jgi:hypothetical protein
MSKLSNSVDLAKTSLAVLNEDKVLAAFPVVSAVLCGVVVLVFGGGAYASLQSVADPSAGTNATTLQPTPATWAIGIVGLLVAGFVAQFFTGALIAGANQRLEGTRPTFGSSVSIAGSHLGSLTGWAVINATVGMILQAIRERAGILGGVVAALGGAAWNIVTWLTLPVIIVEGAGPIEAVKRSAHLLKTTWGENVIAQIGLGALSFLLLLPGLVVFGLLWLISPVITIVGLIFWAAVVGVVMAALGAIYRVALYRYAVGLPTGGGFTQEMLAGAFGPKKGKGGALGGTSGTFN